MLSHWLFWVILKGCTATVLLSAASMVQNSLPVPPDPRATHKEAAMTWEMSDDGA